MCRNKTTLRRTRKKIICLSDILSFGVITTVTIILKCTATTNALDLSNSPNNTNSRPNHDQSQLLPNSPQAATTISQIHRREDPQSNITSTPRVTTNTNQINYDKCLFRRSCRATARSRMLDVDAKKQSCTCDMACVQYDDCCADSKFATPAIERINEHGLRAARSQWFCHKTGLFGDVYIKASCSPEWLSKNTVKISDSNHQQTNSKDIQAKAIRQNCEHIATSGMDSSDDAQQAQIVPQLDDPLGMMMHITDLVSGITYANSYCLQCNSINFTQSRLLYWSPVLDCSYDITKDDRNELLDLISLSKGKALKYSVSLRQWVINAPNSDNKTQQIPAKSIPMSNVTESHMSIEASTAAASKSNTDNLVCKIGPIMPNSVEHIIRFCKSNVIDRCPMPQLNINSNNQSSRVNNQYSSTNKTLVDECHLGYQALVYSQTTDLVYRNLACAHCNNEYNVYCEPKMRKILSDTNEGRRLSPDPSGTEDLGTGQGSFSVLMDLYGSSHDDQQVGVVHQCAGQTQIFDPIFLTCRDVICGLNLHYEDGKCIPNDLDSDENRSIIPSSATIEVNVTNSTTSSLNDTKMNLDFDDTKRPIGNMSVRVDPTLETTTMATTTDSREKTRSIDQESEATSSMEETTTLSAQLTSISNVGSSVLASDLDELSGNRNNLTDPHHTNSAHHNITDHIYSKVDDTDVKSTNYSASDSSNVIRGNTARSINESKPYMATDTNHNGSTVVVNLSSLTSNSQSDGSIHKGYDNSDTTSSSTGINSAKATKQAFLECGKIYIPRSQFKLINHSSSLQDGKWILFAHVEPYNLTLDSNQYILESNGEKLLICTPFKTDLVRKFRPLMSIITTIGLLISITSLTLFLLLYISSACVSCASKYGRRNSVGGSSGHNSLSSRGVVCLSTSLLLAYILFLGGQWLDSINQDYDICVLVAIGTYFCFLMSFNWMFLLSYDIWRTLRLATCHLRGPIIHAQSKRFLIYMIYSLTISIGIVSMAIYVETQPRPLSLSPSSFNHQHNQANNNSSAGDSSQQSRENNATNEVSKPIQMYTILINSIINDYKPKFGQRQGMCWFTNRRGLALFFGLPVTVIMIFNLLFFLHSSIMVIMTSTRSSRRRPPQVGVTLVSSVAHNPDKSSSDRYNMKKKKFKSRTISSSSLASNSTICSFECNTSVDRSKYIIPKPEDLPSVIVEDVETSSESLSVNENNKSILARIKRLFRSGKRSTCCSLESLRSTESYKECCEDSCSKDDKLDTYDNNLTIQSTINNEMRNIGDHIRKEEQEGPDRETKLVLDAHHESQSYPVERCNSVIATNTDRNIKSSNNTEIDDASKKRASITISNTSSNLPLVNAKSKQTKRIASPCNRQLHQQLSLVLASVSKDYRLYWRLSTIMGLTWLTGVLASFADSDIMWYLFVILNTLQGLFIFIAFGCKRSKLENVKPLVRKLGLDKLLMKKTQASNNLQQKKEATCKKIHSGD